MSGDRYWWQRKRLRLNMKYKRKYWLAVMMNNFDFPYKEEFLQFLINNNSYNVE